MDYPKYVKINDSDLLLAIREGMHPMTEWFDPKHNNLPYFWNYISGKSYGNSHHPSYSGVHTTGRWLDALVSASQTTGEPLPRNAIENLRYWAYEVFNNNMGMPANINLETMESISVCDLHNLREAMYAFVALLRIDPDDQNAQKMARHLIQMVDTYTDFATGNWKAEQFERERGGHVECGASNEHEVYRFSSTLGRYIGALVRLYYVYPIPEALDQAVRLTETCLSILLKEDGAFCAEIFGQHIHSTTSMLSGVAMLGDLIGDMGILKHVKAFMENGIRELGLDMGWFLENYGRNDLVGEINNTCDIVEVCLCLGRAGYSEYYEMAERMIRSHVLPAQLLDVSFLSDEATDDDATNHMASRMKGAFGFPCPYGHEYQPGSEMSFNWDIVGGGVSGLCIAKGHQVTYYPYFTSINLLFDYTDEAIYFADPYKNGNTFTLETKRSLTVRIRLSSRTDKDAIGAALEKTDLSFTIHRGWLYLEKLSPGQTISIPMAFTQEEKKYTFREHTLRFRFEGDRVVAAASQGKRLCFFPEL